MWQQLKWAHWLSFFLLLGWLGQSSYAIRVTGLYESTVLVRDQGATERARGVKAGLEEVLIKVSGNRWAKSNPTLAEALKRADSYLFEFSYTSNKRTVVDSNNNRLEARELKLQFDNKSIDRLIQQAGLPVWDSNRPGVLLWVAVETPQGRRILSAEDRHPAIGALRLHAQRRGLPLLLPAMDIEDQSALSVGQVWNLNQAAISRASKRYQSSAVLAGYIFPSGGNDAYSGKWLYLGETDTRHFASDPANLSNYISQGVDQVADQLAKVYAVQSANNPPSLNSRSSGNVDSESPNAFLSKSGVTVQVIGVQSVDAYAAVSAYLSSLSAVKSANVSHIQGDTLWFSIESEGSVSQLQRIIGLNNRLVAERNPIYGESGGTLLYYRWQ